MRDVLSSPPGVPHETQQALQALEGSPLALQAWLPIDPQDLPVDHRAATIAWLEQVACQLRAQRALEVMGVLWPEGLLVLRPALVEIEGGVWEIQIEDQTEVDEEQTTLEAVVQWLDDVRPHWELEHPGMRRSFARLFDRAIAGPEDLPQIRDTFPPEVALALDERRLAQTLPSAPAGRAPRL